MIQARSLQCHVTVVKHYKPPVELQRVSREHDVKTLYTYVFYAHFYRFRLEFAIDFYIVNKRFEHRALKRYA